MFNLNTPRRLVSESTTPPLSATTLSDYYNANIDKIIKIQRWILRKRLHSAMRSCRESTGNNAVLKTYQSQRMTLETYDIQTLNQITDNNIAPGS